MRTTIALLSVLLQLASTSTAQILSTGNTALPACAQGCDLLNQAVAACSGQTASNQGTWSCFCQSGYLKSLYSTPSGICDAVCTDPTQNQQVMTWYTSNCGTDLGASEHAGQAVVSSAAGAAAPTTAATTTTSATSGTASTAGAVIANGNGLNVNSDGTPVQSGSWWSNHYKWIIMLIVLFIGLALLAFLIIWLKRRHDRRQDTAVGGFNEGITMRPTAMKSTAPPVALPPTSGRDSPARTRDAFMPYGYGYARSESRLGSRTNVAESQMAKNSALANDGAFTDTEKDAGTSTRAGKKRIYVRERGMHDAERL